MQRRRYGKDQMKIPTYRQAAFQLIYPYELFGILALVAVPVPAGVVSDSVMIALATLLKMTAMAAVLHWLIALKALSWSGHSLCRSKNCPPYSLNIWATSKGCLLLIGPITLSWLIERAFNRRINSGHMEIHHSSTHGAMAQQFLDQL